MFLPEAQPPTVKIQAKIKTIYEGSIFVEYQKEKYYVISGSTEEYMIGDIVELSAPFFELKNNDIFSLFVLSNGAKYYSYDDPEVVQQSNSIRNKLLSSIIEQKNEYSKYTEALLYKKKNNDTKEIFDLSNNLGISHLFIISGFHISLFMVVLDKINAKWIKHNKIRSLLNSLITLSFLWFIFMPPTGLRALLATTIHKQSKLSSIDSLAVTALLFFMFNPFIMFTASMLLSFGITFAIYMIIDSKPKGKTFLIALISLTAFSISMPIVATWNNKFNLLAPVFTILLSPIVSAYYILIILTLPLHMISFIFDPLFWILNIILSTLSLVTIEIYKDIIDWWKASILLISTYGIIHITRNHRTWTFLTLFINIFLINI